MAEPGDEVSFRPDPLAARRVALWRGMRLRVKDLKSCLQHTLNSLRARDKYIKSLATDETPCEDCGLPIMENRRFVGMGKALCHDCESEAFGH
jgi:hypothetical protein